MWRSYCREQFCEMRCLFALQKFSFRYPRCSLSRGNSVWGSPLKFLKSSLLLQSQEVISLAWMAVSVSWILLTPRSNLDVQTPPGQHRGCCHLASAESIIRTCTFSPRPFVLQHFSLGVATSLTFHSMLAWSSLLILQFSSETSAEHTFLTTLFWSPSILPSPRILVFLTWHITAAHCACLGLASLPRWAAAPAETRWPPHWPGCQHSS